MCFTQLEKSCQLCLVHCLKKLSGIYEPQDLEPERDKVLHDELDDTDGVEPNNSSLRSTAGVDIQSISLKVCRKLNLIKLSFCN